MVTPGMTPPDASLTVPLRTSWPYATTGNAMTAMSTGHRYPGAEAKEAGLVDATAAEAEIVTAALGRLQPILGKDRATLGAIKSTMFASVTEALGRGPGGVSL